MSIANIILAATFGVAGATLGCRALLRRRHLRKLGFTADDLSSKENFYRRLGEITVQRMPRKISLIASDNHPWSKKGEYARSAAALERLGFERNSVFAASPQKWVAEVWLSKEEGLFAVILDQPPLGIHTNVVVEYKDGSTVSFENTDECGRRHLENHNWIHCGPIMLDDLLQRALRDRHGDYVGQMQLRDCIRAYERALNENLAWRQKIGFTADEIKQSQERARRYQSLQRKLS